MPALAAKWGSCGCQIKSISGHFLSISVAYFYFLIFCNELSPLVTYNQKASTEQLGKEEAELIARCQKGDIKAYELLYKRFSGAMYHTCLRIVQHEADAEDILQDAFMEAFANLRKIKNAEAFAGWLKRIVINKAINQAKRLTKSWPELAETGLADTFEDEAFDETLFANQLEAIMAALNNLAPKYRIVVNLHIFEQLSFEEIASEMSIPSATVRSQYLRARQKILEQVSIK